MYWNVNCQSNRIQCHNVLNILVQFAVVSFIFVYSSSQWNHIKGYSPVSMYNRKVALFHHNIHPYPHSRAHILILILIHIHNRIRIRIHKTMIWITRNEMDGTRSLSQPSFPLTLALALILSPKTKWNSIICWAEWENLEWQVDLAKSGTQNSNNHLESKRTHRINSNDECWEKR